LLPAQEDQTKMYYILIPECLLILVLSVFWILFTNIFVTLCFMKMFLE